MHESAESTQLSPPVRVGPILSLSDLFVCKIETHWVTRQSPTPTKQANRANCGTVKVKKVLK